MKEPCQSLASSSASGNLGFGGKLKYHCTANDMRSRATVVRTEGDAAKVLSAAISSIFAATMEDHSVGIRMILGRDVFESTDLRNLRRRRDVLQIHYQSKREVEKISISPRIELT